MDLPQEFVIQALWREGQTSQFKGQIKKGDGQSGRVKDPDVIVRMQVAADAVADVLDLCDMVLIMTVNPGFGGQKFIDMSDKIRTLRAMIGDRPVHIEIDGGVDVNTASSVAQAGADVLVAGSAVFRGGSVSNPAPYGENIRAIRAAAEGVYV